MYSFYTKYDLICSVSIMFLQNILHRDSAFTAGGMQLPTSCEIYHIHYFKVFVVAVVLSWKICPPFLNFPVLHLLINMYTIHFLSIIHVLD